MKGQRWIVDIMTFLLFGFLLFELIKTSVLMPTMAKALGLNLVQTGLILGIFSGGPGIIMGTVGGFITDKLGARWTGVFPLLGFTAATIGIGLVNSYSQLAGIILIYGSLNSFVNAIVYKLTGNWFGNRQRGLGAGVTNAASPFFTFLAPALAVPLLIYFNSNFRDVFFIFALVAIPLAILWFVFVYDRPEQSPLISIEELKNIYQEELQDGTITEDELSLAHKERKPLNKIIDRVKGSNDVTTAQAISVIFKSGRGWGLILGIGLMNLIWGSYAIVLPTYFTDFMGYKTSVVGTFTTITYFAGFLAAIISGALTLRFRKLTLMKIGTIVSLIATVPLTFVSTSTPPEILLAITTIGFFSILVYFPPFFSLTAEYFGRAILGRVLGIQYSFIALALAFGPTLMTDIAATYNWRYSYLFVTVMVLIAIALTFIVKEKKESTEAVSREMTA